jgi:hypothetical protein
MRSSSYGPQDLKSRQFVVVGQREYLTEAEISVRRFG